MAKHGCPYCKKEMVLEIDEKMGQQYVCPACGYEESNKF